MADQLGIASVEDLAPPLGVRSVAPLGIASVEDLAPARPAPVQVDRQFTSNVKVSGPAATFPPRMSAQPPAVAPVDDQSWRTGDPEASFGEIASTADPIQGAKQLLRGAHDLVGSLFTPPSGDTAPAPTPLDMTSEVPPTPLRPATKNALSDMIEGTFRSAEPLVAAAIVSAPVTAAVALGVATAASKAASAAVKAMGGSDDSARLAGNVAAAAVAGGATDILMRSARAKISSVAADARAVNAQVAAHDAAYDAANPPPPTEPIPVGRGATEAASAPQPPAEPPGAFEAVVGDRPDRFKPIDVSPEPPLAIASVEPLPTASERPVDVAPPPAIGPEPPTPSAELPPGEPAAPLSIASFEPLKPESAQDIVRQHLAAQGPVDPDVLASALQSITHTAHQRSGTPPSVAVPRDVALDVAREWVAQQRGDVLDTGELQPRLPGDAGAVRETQTATPQVAEVPFSLSAEAASSTPAQPNLLEARAPALPAKPEPRSVRAAEAAWPTLTKPVQREVRRILAEMEHQGHSGKTFDETTRRGGDLEVKGRVAGAPVYWDIVGGNPDGGRPTFSLTRGDVIQKLRAYVETGKRTVASDLAVDVAQRRLAGERGLQKASLPVDAGDKPGEIYVTRERGLKPEYDAAQEAIARRVEDDPEPYVQALVSSGRPISTDAAREIILKDATTEERQRFNPVAQRAASAVAAAARRQALAAPTPDGKDSLVAFVAGATGAGKTSVINDVPGLRGVLNSAAVQLEGTYKNFDEAKRQIQEARRAGHAVAFMYVHRGLVPSYEQGVLGRTGDDFRPVTPEFHAEAHIAAPATFARLVEYFADDPKVEFLAVDNTGPKHGAHVVDLAKVTGLTYNEDDVRQSLEDVLDRAAQGEAGLAAKAGAVRAAQARFRETPSGGDGAPSAVQRPEGSSGTGSGVSGAAREGLRRSEDPRRTADGADDVNPSGGSGDAMAGLFAEALPVQAAQPARPIQPVQFPELVAFARELASTPGVVKAFRNAGVRGMFRGDGSIRLRADLFKAGEEQQLAATLAHEIGHLVDWLPHRTLKRGNVLGRLFSLRGFLKHTFIAPDGSQITQKEIRAELTALSNKWRPWDPEKASASFAAYRKSSKEIFADAISVLLNNPGLLEKDAPIFYEQFFTALDQKPDVKAAYFGLQELLSGTPEELIARRRAGVQEMFGVGDTRAMDLERLRQQEQRESWRDLWTRARIEWIDKNTPLIDRVKALEKQGVVINPDDDPRYFLEERNYLGGKLKAFTEEHFLPIYATLTKHDIDWHTFGEALFYERIIAGDRGEVANPRGISPAVATDLRNDLMRGLSPEQRRVLRSSTTGFRTVLKGVAEDAYQEGLYTDDLHTQMQENEAYVPFRVIEHLESHVTSRVYRQVGTLKDITNPADTAMLKTLVTLRAIEHQKVKVASFDFLTQHYPGDIEQAKEVGGPKGRQPIDPRDGKREMVTYYDHGRLRGKYVDAYIANSLTNGSVGQNLATLAAFKFANSRHFRPIFTTFNLGFQASNFVRDLLRTWTNAPDMTLWQAMKRYRQAVPMARVRAFGLPEKATFAQRQAHKDLLQVEQDQVLSVTLNDILAGRAVEDTQLEETLAKLGIGGFGGGPPRKGLIAGVHAVLDWIRQTGDFIETLPKAAAIYQFSNGKTVADLTADQRSFIRRKIGSPDFLASGSLKPMTNTVFLFSNAILQALRSDFEVASDPKTRSGWWWKNAKLRILPKLLQFAAIVGLGAWLAGDDEDDDQTPTWKKNLHAIHRAFRGISEYDLTNYLVLPLGFDTDGKTIYARLPDDGLGRLIGGLTWKVLRGLGGDRDVAGTAMQVFDYVGGQAPTVTPTIGIVKDVAAVASGQNVYDSFRSRLLFTDDEMKAGGTYKGKKFLSYEFQQFGGGIIGAFRVGDRPHEQTPAQRVLDLPVVSNIVGRWIKISDFGAVEQLRKAKADVEREESRARLGERAAVNDAVRAYQQLPPPDQTRAKQQELARAIVADVHADARGDVREAAYNSVLKKIRMGVTRGGTDNLIDAVLGATSNAQKTHLIVTAADGMSSTDFYAWLMRARREDVVSEKVRIDVLQALGRRRATEEKKAQ